MDAATRQILVTSALPYANGPIHIGHLVEYLQTDIWVRYQKLTGNDCIYVCASDAHGTPIMLRARDEGVDPEELVENYRRAHKKSFAAFHIDFDNYHSTHSPENQALVETIFKRLDAAGLIARKTILQAYDEQAGMFLPDRFLRGTCPNCKAPDQYGDNCEVCGATYDASELGEPYSILTNTPPVQRESEHLFFRLGEFTGMLRAWIDGGAVDAAIANKLDEWLTAGLKDWDISRDAPYFGFPVPGHKDKYFYVWLDAPVGYIASLANLAARNSAICVDDYFSASSTAELYHFIGKDIINFHALFWPAVLDGAGYRKPTAVYAHGFLTVNGQKMSKSRGTFIAADTYLKHLDPEYLRYYYACKLGSGIDDIDLNFEDFVSRVNADLVGKLVNIASRCAGFITRQFDGRLAAELERPELYAEFVAAGEEIAGHYEAREFARATRVIMQLADKANQYIDERKPWVLAKKETDQPQVQAVCTQGLNLFRLLMIYLAPVLPAMSAKVERFLNIDCATWADLDIPLLDKQINRFEPLAARVDNKQVEQMIEDSKPADAGDDPQTPAEDAYISYDDFMKVDLRIAKVLAAEHVDGADKLLRVRLDDGDGERSILAGIKADYEPDQLVGRYVVIVANLAPKKMRFGTSEGMILAAGDAAAFLVSPDDGAEAGMRVR